MVSRQGKGGFGMGSFIYVVLRNDLAQMTFGWQAGSGSVICVSVYCDPFGGVYGWFLTNVTLEDIFIRL